MWLEVSITLQLTSDVSQLAQMPCRVGGGEPFISSALFIRCYVADTWKVSQSLTGMLTQYILQSFFLLGDREPRDLKALFTRQLQVWIWSLLSNWGFRTEKLPTCRFLQGSDWVYWTCVHVVVAKIKSWHRSFSEILRQNACVPLRGIRM